MITKLWLTRPTPTLMGLQAERLTRNSSSSGDYPLSISGTENLNIERYGLLELGLQTNLLPDNPYDTNEIDLRVQFTAPSGKVVEVGAFWYQGFNLQTRQAEGEPGWKVRFTPDETGRWEAFAHAPELGLQSDGYVFNVIASNRPGFIRIHPTNPRYLAFDTGNFFFPIGVNMAWSRGQHDPIENYSRWIDQFSANGGNTIRVWMAAWSFGIEWKDTGLGNYDRRQYEAWLLDQLFQLARAHNLKIILVLINHGSLSLDANAEWQDNPYNKALGGPLASPEEFVTDPIAKAYFKQRLSYILNRWGYSPDLLAWEWFNEVDLTPISDETLIPWLQEMTAYLRQRDVNHHLTTNSFSVRYWSPVWQLPEVDLVQRHEYTSQYMGDNRDLAGRTAQDLQFMAQIVPKKPILLGEFGYSSSDYGDSVEETGIHLHNGLWATAFSGYAGSGMYWWWDNYIDTNNLWKHFNSLSNFLDGEDLTQYQPFSPLILYGQEAASEIADGLGLRSTKTLLWLRSEGYTVQAAVRANNGEESSSTYLPRLVEDLRIVLDGMTNGEYIVSWYNPQSSGWMDQVKVSVIDSTLTILVPPFHDDLAAKVAKNP